MDRRRRPSLRDHTHTHAHAHTHHVNLCCHRRESRIRWAVTERMIEGFSSSAWSMCIRSIQRRTVVSREPTTQSDGNNGRQIGKRPRFCGGHPKTKNPRLKTGSACAMLCCWKSNLDLRRIRFRAICFLFRPHHTAPASAPASQSHRLSSDWMPSLFAERSLTWSQDVARSACRCESAFA